MALILIVDDESSIVETLAEVLSWEGHTTLTASNGERALEILRDGARPDLVMLDFMMPVRDGIQTLRAMRADPALEALPVILMTAVPRSVPADAPRYDELLAKPFGIAPLKAALAKLLPPR